MKQTISKITLITGLLFTNVVKSQEFYTCVPKEDWVKNVSKSLQRSDEEIRNLARQVNGIKCGFYDIYKDKNILQGKSILLDRGFGSIVYHIYICPNGLDYSRPGESNDVFCGNRHVLDKRTYDTYMTESKSFKSLVCFL